MKIRFKSIEYEMDEHTGIGLVRLASGMTLYGHPLEAWHYFIGCLSRAGEKIIGEALEKLGRNRFGLDYERGLQSTAKESKEAEHERVESIKPVH